MTGPAATDLLKRNTFEATAAPRAIRFSLIRIDGQAETALHLSLGTLVSLEIETNNGTVAFLGTVNPATGIINGTYTVVGGTCAQTGTAVLALGGQWDY